MSINQMLERASDLHFGGLRIWVHHRQNPSAKDYWDGNWISCTAICEALTSMVKVTGPFLHLPEIEYLHDELDKLDEQQIDEMELECMDPNLSLSLAVSGSLGGLKLTVKLTPDHITQHHTFVFETDRSWLPRVMADCGKILAKYPIVGDPVA